MDRDPSPDQSIAGDVPTVSASVLDSVRKRLAERQPYQADAVRAAKGISDPRWEVRAAAVGRLSATGHLEMVRTALRDEHPLVRAAAVRALGALGAYEEVVLAFHDADWQVREMVVLTLRAAGRAEGHLLLQAAHADPDRSVREAAVMAWGRADPARTEPAALTGWWQQASAYVHHLMQVCRAQTRLVDPRLWWSVASLLVCTTGFLALALRATPGFVHTAGGLLALAIVLCAAGGVALLADPQKEAAHEVVLTTQTPQGVLLLSRAALVVIYVAALGTVGSLVIALASGLPVALLLQLWAPPLLAVVALALALAALMGSAGAFLGTALTLVVQTCGVHLVHGLAVTFDTHLWGFSPGLLLVSLALVLFTGWYASRHPRVGLSQA